MKNILKEFLLFTITFLYFLYIFNNNTYITQNIIETFNLWLTKIVPSLFPTFIIIDLIKYSNIPYYLSKYFHIDYIYIFSIISGSPSNAYLLKNEKNISKQLATTKYPSFLFTYNFLKKIFNKNIAIIIIISNILSHIILIYFIKPPKKNYSPQNNNLFNILLKSIKTSLETLITILGTIIFFNTLPVSKIKNIYLKSFILSFLEITTSFNNLMQTSLPLNIKIFMSIITISTCGLCIECQIKSIINDTSLNFSTYLKYCLYNFIIFGTITFLMLQLI